MHHFNRAAVWTSIALLMSLFCPNVLAVPVNLSFAMSLDPLALHGHYSSIQLIGYKPFCQGDGAYHELLQPMPLTPGTTTVSPVFDMGDMVVDPAGKVGGIFCLIFNVTESGGFIRKVRIFFSYLVRLQHEGVGTFTIHDITLRLNEGGAAPRFEFGPPLNQLPALGAFLGAYQIQLRLPIVAIMPRIPLGSLANMGFLESR